METIQQVNKYYNYILLDPRHTYKWYLDNIEFDYLPFYVGKGSGYRVKSHYKQFNGENPYKENIIKKLNKGGFIPTYKIVYDNLSEQQAFENESIIIDKINKLFGDILTNILPGGEQPPVRYGINNHKSKKVYQYDKDSGKLLAEYDCILDGARATGSINNATHICECCEGKRRTSAGFIWKYEKYDSVKNNSGKWDRIKFKKLIAYNDSEYHEFVSMKEAYQFLKTPNKGKISEVLKGNKSMYKGFYWKYEN